LDTPESSVQPGVQCTAGTPARLPEDHDHMLKFDDDEDDTTSGADAATANSSGAYQLVPLNASCCELSAVRAVAEQTPQHAYNNEMTETAVLRTAVRELACRLRGLEDARVAAVNAYTAAQTRADEAEREVARLRESTRTITAVVDASRLLVQCCKSP
jgi:hypothetical protein